VCAWGRQGERVFGGPFAVTGDHLVTAPSAAMRDSSSHLAGILCGKRSLDHNRSLELPVVSLKRAA
jgi:hypothetical protein